MIKRTEEENLLIYRVESDDSSPWFRFHPLFGEFLAARLARRGPRPSTSFIGVPADGLPTMTCWSRRCGHADSGGRSRFRRRSDRAGRLRPDGAWPTSARC
jgi:hypothetical protein